MNTVLEDVKFEVGNQITLTEEGKRSIRSFAKENPTIKNAFALFEITSVKTTWAEDEHTELKEQTIGCTGLRNVETGETFTVEADDPVLWAFFTEATPHFFNLQKVKS